MTLSLRFTDDVNLVSVVYAREILFGEREALRYKHSWRQQP